MIENLHKGKTASETRTEAASSGFIWTCKCPSGQKQNLASLLLFSIWLLSWLILFCTHPGLQKQHFVDNYPLKKITFCFSYASLSCVCAHAHVQMCNCPPRPEEASDLMELELQALVSYTKWYWDTNSSPLMGN